MRSSASASSRPCGHCTTVVHRVGRAEIDLIGMAFESSPPRAGFLWVRSHSTTYFVVCWARRREPLAARLVARGRITYRARSLNGPRHLLLLGAVSGVVGGPNRRPAPTIASPMRHSIASPAIFTFEFVSKGWSSMSTTSRFLRLVLPGPWSWLAVERKCWQVVPRA